MGLGMAGALQHGCIFSVMLFTKASTMPWTLTVQLSALPRTVSVSSRSSRAPEEMACQCWRHGENTS